MQPALQSAVCSPGRATLVLTFAAPNHSDRLRQPHVEETQRRTFRVATLNLIMLPSETRVRPRSVVHPQYIGEDMLSHHRAWTDLHIAAEHLRVR